MDKFRRVDNFWFGGTKDLLEAAFLEVSFKDSKTIIVMCLEKICAMCV